MLDRFRNQRRKLEEFRLSTWSRSSNLGNAAASHLSETIDFGSNPGGLRMFTHIPQKIPSDCALMVVLHGCKQSAASYDLGAGWSTLADRFGFVLLLPEQQPSNNPNGCFNWFQPGDTQRGQGEAHSIREMIERAISDHGINPARVYVTGLSAGGAMASVMLATYPEIFAGGAIVAGLPYGAANNVQQAFESMFQCPARPASAWGDLVRQASPYEGPWPRISVWHGGADTTVVPGNAEEIVKQWINVHALTAAPSARSTLDGYPRQAWLDKAGKEVLESYTITGMAHGTPLATGSSDNKCGTAGPFLLEVGISSSYHIAKFFGLTAAGADHASKVTGLIPVTSEAPKTRPEASASLQHRVLEGEVLRPEEPDGAPNFTQTPPPFDVGAVINQALKSAGLMKGG